MVEKSSTGRNHYCPAGGKRDHATWLRNRLPEGTTTVLRVEREIMQHGCEDHAMGKLGHQLRQMRIRRVRWLCMIT